MTKDVLAEELQTACLNIVSDWEKQGLSDDEIRKRLTEDTIPNGIDSILDRASKDYREDFFKRRFEISQRQRIEADTFFAHNNEIWGECFILSETMYEMALESSQQYCAFFNDSVPNDGKREKLYTFLALRHMLGRCCQEFLEILYLMKLGFADGAYARWRSMYELCCNASFIIRHGETIAKQYMEQSQTEDHQYSWTRGAKNDDGTELKIRTFQGIQDDCKADSFWKKQYKLSCFVNHGSPQGTFKRLCLKDNQPTIVVGYSDYGIPVPAVHSAISLAWITNLFLTIFRCLDAEAHARAISDWVGEISTAYFGTLDKCLGTTSDHREEEE